MPQPPLLEGDAPRVLAQGGPWVFCYKPAFMHSVAGKNPPSLEEALPDIWPQPLLLCNRLDFETSGLVTAAHDADGLHAWRAAEDAGQGEKRYVALLCGHLEQAATLTRALDTHKRVTTKVLKTDAPPLRHTLLTPLALLHAGDISCAAAPALAAHPALCSLRGADPHTPLTLAGCCIHKGARHQIRAHAAHAGHPLWGDGRYGAPVSGGFLLHHGALTLPGAEARCAAPWFSVLPDAARAEAHSWLGLP